MRNGVGMLLFGCDVVRDYIDPLIRDVVLHPLLNEVFGLLPKFEPAVELKRVVIGFAKPSEIAHVLVHLSLLVLVDDIVCLCSSISSQDSKNNKLLHFKYK